MTNQKKYAHITGVGYEVGSECVTNEMLAKRYPNLDTSDEWIQKRSGIKSRYFIEGELSASDLAIKASERALEMAGISKQSIDCILFSTLTPDHEFPGTGCFFQSKMDMSGIPVFDVKAQCTSFLYAIQMADSFIKSGVYKNILIVGSEVQSRGLDFTIRGRDTAVLFGDGAGAVVVQASDDPSKGIQDVVVHADGKFAKELWVEAPGCAVFPNRVDAEMILDGRTSPKMNGKLVFMHAVTRMPEVLKESCQRAGIEVANLDLIVPHQANLRINEAVVEQLGLPKSKGFNTISRFGNTTSATIPIGLKEALNEGALKSGMTIGLVGFGSGFTWGAAVIKW